MRNAPLDRRSFSVAEVAAAHGVDVGKVRQWIANGELRAMDLAERRGTRPRWRISLEALELFERSRSTDPRPPETRRTNRAELMRGVKKFV